jgi:hypothetical protein
MRLTPAQFTAQSTAQRAARLAATFAARVAGAGLAALLALTACAAPGVDIAPQPGDYAFIEVALQG